jgi:hypothetical protein
MAKNKSYYLGVTLTERAFHKICVRSAKPPTKEQLLEALQNGDTEELAIDDTMDEEQIDYLTVEKIKVLQEDEIDE